MGQKKTVYSLAVYGLVLGKKPTQIRSQGSLQRRNQKPKSKKVKTSDYIYLKKFNHTQKNQSLSFQHTPQNTSQAYIPCTLALGYFPKVLMSCYLDYFRLNLQSYTSCHYEGCYPSNKIKGAVRHHIQDPQADQPQQRLPAAYAMLGGVYFLHFQYLS